MRIFLPLPLAFGVLALGLAGCGSDATPPDRGVPPADVSQILPDAGSQFGNDADAAAATTDASAVDTPDSSAPFVTECTGRCGVYLEGNPCHCHADCAAEGNCCGGSAAFTATCACSKPADCDDAKPCTSDSCLGGICRQIPVGGSCCAQDSDCSGGDACNLAKCIDNSCTIVAKDCNDGLACTTDSCNEGVCSHQQASGTCYVEGVCYAAGTAATQGCGVCDPVKSATSLSTPAGQCKIGNACFAAGPSPDLTCAYCDPLSQPDAWTVKLGWCVIDGQCVADGSSHPTASCLQCKADADKYAWTILDGFCQIGDSCVPAKTISEGGCAVCDPVSNPKGWTPSNASTCALPCLSNATCQAGKCVGTKLPPGQCCTSNADCVGQLPGLTTCQEAVCSPATNKCIAQTKQDCCLAGVCCDLATSTYKPAGSDCNGPVSDKERRCNGNSIEERTVHAGCTGNHQSTCSAVYPYFGPWTLYLPCSNGPCVIDASSGQPKCPN